MWVMSKSDGLSNHIRLMEEHAISKAIQIFPKFGAIMPQISQFNCLIFEERPTTDGDVNRVIKEECANDVKQLKW